MANRVTGVPVWKERDHARGEGEAAPGPGSGSDVFLQGHLYGPDDPESLCQFLKNCYNTCY